MTTATLFFLFFLLALALIVSGSQVAVGANKPGIGGRVYRNTGTYGSPTWTHFDYVKDVTVAMPWDFVEAGGRMTRAKVKMKARVDLSFDVTVKTDDADTHYVAVRAAAVSPTSVVDLLILDGLISVEGVAGFRCEFGVSLVSEGQEADGSIYDTFHLEPVPTNNADGPSTVIMGSGSVPTFIAL